jgi:predicted transport protein
VIAYHYSSKKITDVDLSKCENGFWFTSIDPATFKEVENNGVGIVGCADCSYAHKVEFNVNDVDTLVNIAHSDIEKYLSENLEKIARFGYEDLEVGIEYSDYVTFDTSNVKILSIESM